MVGYGRQEILTRPWEGGGEPGRLLFIESFGRRRMAAG